MNYHKKSVRDIDVSGKKVFLRCDFNVPLDDNGQITDDIRIRGALPTIRYLLEQGAAIILCSHLGRPKGKVVPKLSLKPVAQALEEFLNIKVPMAEDINGPIAQMMANGIRPGQVMLLENIRFRPEEEANDPDFAKSLAALADIYVNDAFGTAHRAHASTAGIADYLPAVCGFLIEKEITTMGKAMENPEHPFVAILGGSKVSEKLKLIEKLLVEHCDTVLVLGAMSYTFRKALGGRIGNSLCEDSMVEEMGQLMERAKDMGCNLLLPVDNVVADKFDNDADIKVVPAGQIPDGYMGMDIGPATAEIYSRIIESARTVVWNGPAGVFEMPNFAHGTQAIATAVAKVKGVSIIGGGDSAAAIDSMGFSRHVTHISTGGGASLEFLQGMELPGIACLDDAE
ncbi:MAG: phosphoglycerate kinase [Clostridiaceae bacterium]|nr:phosphoglycerate kinase [Clostridia bacterium]MDY3870881.1 phosphoglycerate kinase [Clostridiaceae bacterium]